VPRPIYFCVVENAEWGSAIPTESNILRAVPRLGPYLRKDVPVTVGIPGYDMRL